MHQSAIRLGVAAALFAAVCAQPIFAQNSEAFFKLYPANLDGLPKWAAAMYSHDPNVHEVVDLYNAHYAKNSFDKNIHTQNYKFWLRNVEEFVDGTGHIRIPAPKDAQAKLDRMRAQRKIGKQQANAKNQAIWSCIGPFDTYKNDGSLDLRPTQANVYAIAVAPSNTDVLYCITESGGLFKTVNKGLNWSLASLDEPFTSGADLKVHPTNPDMVYLASGSNVYKTSDGGASWSLNYTMPGKIEQFCIHKSNPNNVFAATEGGLYKTNNNGNTWNLVMNERCWDIEPNPLNPDVMYLSVSNSSLKRAEVYKTVDAGATWVLKGSGWYMPTDPANALDRGCKIGLTPADTARVYAGLIGDSKAGDNGWIGIYYSLDGAATWVNADGIDGGPYVSGNDMNTNWFVAGYSSGYHQGWYNYDLDVSHSNPDRLWVGTIWSCESANRGANIEYIRGTRSLEMHADVQDIDVAGSDIWYVSDGGINYSNDEMQTVETRNTGISASNYWGFGQGWNEDVWTGGRYHNGDAVNHENYGVGNSIFLGGAESATGYINPFNNRKAHFSDITDKLLPDGLATPSANIANLSLYPNQSYSTLNSSELEYHPNYADVIYLGKDSSFYKSVDGGASFSALYSFNAGATVLEFEISRPNPDVVYCLVREASAGTIYKSTDGGGSFTPLTALPSNNLSRLDLTLNPSNPDNLWVSSLNGANGQKVYCTTDGGATWVNKTTAALDGHKPLDILYQAGTNDLVYLATDYAVFYWDANATDWTLYSDGLPFVTKALWMKPFYRDGKIRLASGRGVWEAPFAKPSAAIAEPMTLSDTIYCSRDTVQFNDHSFLKHSGASWQWSFSPAPDYIDSPNIRNPKVQFSEEGSYDVTLTVTDQMGNTSSKTLAGMITLANKCLPDSVPGLSLLCTANPDHVRTPSMDILQTNNFTISAWVKPDGIQNSYTGIVFNDDTSGGINFRENNELGYHWPGGAWWWSSGLTVDTSKWSHVALVVTPSSATLYLNGVASTHNTSPTPIDIGTMRIGSYKGWSDRNYKGEIDEVCIWNRALPQNEIRELRHLTRTGTNPYNNGLVAYYQFNLPESSRVLDKVSGRHGSLNGNAQKTLSTAPVGHGTSHRRSISAPGGYSFGDTGLELGFGSAFPNGELVATRLHLPPDSLPNNNQHAGNYWILNDYSNSGAIDVNYIKFKPYGGFPGGDPADAALFIRVENEDLNNWNHICEADDFVNGTYNYGSACNISGAAQFFVQSLNQNDIFEASNCGQLSVTYGNVFLTTSVTRTRDYIRAGDYGSGIVAVMLNQDVDFYCENRILLEPGFSVPEGAGFTAEIENCPASKAGLAEFAPDETELELKAFPNPFGGELFIEYRLPEAANASLALYDITGRKVRSLVEARQAAGVHTFAFKPEGLPTGFYLCILRANGRQTAAKLVRK